jgi:hypothetical protein
MITTAALKFPAGVFKMPKKILKQDIDRGIKTLADFPERVENTLQTLALQELRYKYRPEGWTIKQVVNHCVDSHMNGLLRFKLALTENKPTIRPFNETLWAVLPDSVVYEMPDTLVLLKAVHNRWCFLMTLMTSNDFEKTCYHPEQEQYFSLKQFLYLYEWHCNNHFGHLLNAIQYKYA